MKINSSKGFEIEIKEGLFKDISLPAGFILTDKNLFYFYPSLITKESFVINPGEKSKSLQVFSEIVSSLKETDKIIAFGGGVVGDLAGFVASTYKRGIKIIQIPTSLLAMVDSSIGGKNGVNLGEKKNYLGTIYQPEKILIDPSFLKTLPLEEFRNGLAEIIKYGILFGEPSLERLEKGISPNDRDLNEIIYQCALIKTKVIERDESDKDYRHVLNFGHTIGHALELQYNLSHGKAISIGMIKELELGIKLGLIKNCDLNRIKKIFEINGLPTSLPDNFNVEKTLEIMRHDKKGKFTFAFSKDNTNTAVNKEILKEVLSK